MYFSSSSSSSLSLCERGLTDIVSDWAEKGAEYGLATSIVATLASVVHARSYNYGVRITNLYTKSMLGTLSVGLKSGFKLVPALTVVGAFSGALSGAVASFSFKSVCWLNSNKNEILKRITNASISGVVDTCFQIKDKIQDKIQGLRG